MVEMQSSKLATKARFPSPAPLLTLTIRFGGVIGAGGKLKTSNLKHGGLNFEIGTLQYPPVVQATPHPHSDNPLCARCRSFCAWNLALGTWNTELNASRPSLPSPDRSPDARDMAHPASCNRLGGSYQSLFAVSLEL